MSFPWSSFLNQRDVRETKVATAPVGNVWTKAGVGFFPVNNNNAEVERSPTSGKIQNKTLNAQLYTDITLPNGITITSAIVYGDTAGAETWTLYRTNISGNFAGTAIATASIDSIDTSITGGVIDNTLYRYFITTSALAVNDNIEAVRIIY